MLCSIAWHVHLTAAISAVKMMTNIGKMVSMTPEQARWVDKEGINLSKFLRGAIDIAMEQDTRDCKIVVDKLRLVNKKLNELLSAYQMDAETIKERVV